MIHKKGFTILEMMIVLSIIALLFLLTLPHIQQKEDIIRKKGCDALQEVVNSQILLYEIEHDTPPTSMEQLIREGYLKESQRRCPGGEQIEIVNGEAHAQ